MDGYLSRTQARAAVTTAAFLWIIHCLLLAVLIYWGDLEPYYLGESGWSPGWATIVVLSLLTLPCLLPIHKRSNGTRKPLLITAVAHIPFIHFGSWISISYFLALSQANRKTIKDIQDEALAAAEQRLGRPVSLGESDQPPGNAPGTDTTTADR